MISRTVVDGVLVVKMNHGKVNALDSEFLSELTDELQKLTNEGCPPFVLTGEGKSFSAGVDLQRVVTGEAAYVRTFLPLLAKSIELLYNYNAPIVAAINGHAIAGGCILAAACDYRIVISEGARLGIPELLVGVPIPSLAFELMRGVVTSPKDFSRLTQFGDTHTGEGAVRVGLADEIASPTDLMPKCIAVLKHLSSLPSGTFVVNKRQMQQPVRDRIAAQAKNDAAAYAQWEKPETFAAIRSYLEKLKK